MKARRKTILNLSFYIMLFGFLVGTLSLFGQKIIADQPASVSGTANTTWLVTGALGIVLVIVGLAGIIFSVLAFQEQ